MYFAVPVTFMRIDPGFNPNVYEWVLLVCENFLKNGQMILESIIRNMDDINIIVMFLPLPVIDSSIF